MNNDPYHSPNSEVESDSESQRSGSLWKGILIGGVADIGGTIAMSTILIIIYMVQVWSPEMTPESIEQVIEQFTIDMASFNNAWSIISHAIGLGFSMLGGYVCAVFAKEKWKKAVLILAAILGGFGLLMGIDVYQFGANLALLLLSVIAIYTGAWLRAGKRY